MYVIQLSHSLPLMKHFCQRSSFVRNLPADQLIGFWAQSYPPARRSLTVQNLNLIRNVGSLHPSPCMFASFHSHTAWIPVENAPASEDARSHQCPCVGHSSMTAPPTSR